MRLLGGSLQGHAPCTKPPATKTTSSCSVGTVLLPPTGLVHHTQPCVTRKYHGGTLLPGTCSKSTTTRVQTQAAALDSIAQQPPQQPPAGATPTQYQKGMIVRGVVDELHAGAASILLTDGSKAKLPWESVTKRAVSYEAWGTHPPLSLGEEILAMVRSEARGREPTRLSTAALESMPGSILVDKQAVFAEAEEWLQTAGSNKPASFSTWRGQRQLQRFIQPALEERSMARKRRGLPGVHDLRPGALVRGLVAGPVKNGLLVQLTAQPYNFGLIPLHLISGQKFEQQELGRLFAPGSEIMVHVRRVKVPSPSHLASKLLIWLSTSDLELEEGSVLRNLPQFNASARDVHAQQQLTRSAVAIREARSLMAEFEKLEERRHADLELPEGSIVRGKVVKYLSPELLLVEVQKGKSLMLHISQVTKAAQGQQQRMAELLPVGSQVLTMVIDKQTRTGKKSVELSIRALEQEPGQFLADPQAYMQHAERCLEQQQQQQQESQRDAPTSSSPSLDTPQEQSNDPSQRNSDTNSNPRAATRSSTPSPTTATNLGSSSSSSGGSGVGTAPRMLRVPPPAGHVRVLAAAAKVLDEQANLGMLVEAAHSSSNQGEYADIAFELGREFLKVSAQVDSAVSLALQGDLPWSPNPPTPIALTTLPTSSSSSTMDLSTNGGGSSNTSSKEAEAQQQQQQQDSFSHQLLDAPEQEGAELSAGAWKRANAAQRALLAINLGLRMKSRALDAALTWQRLKRKGSRGGSSRGSRGPGKVTGPPTPKEGRALLQRAAADACMDALALGTAPAALPAQSHLAHLLANATDSLALLQPPPAAQQQASSSSSGTVGGASRPRLFPTPVSGAPVSATAAAAAAAMGLENEQALGLAAEARNMWFAPAVPLLMEWAVGGRSSGAEVVASGLVPQCIIRGGMLGTLLPDVKAAGVPERSQASTIHTFYDRLFSKLAKSMVPSLKVSAAVAKAHSSLIQQQRQQKQQYHKQQREHAQAAQEPALPSPPPQPLQGALNLLWMGENVGAWRPSHDWWDAFLQRYAAVLPPGVSLFNSPPQNTSSSGVLSGDDKELVEQAGGASTSAAAAEDALEDGRGGAEGVLQPAETSGQEEGSTEQEGGREQGDAGSKDKVKEEEEGGFENEREEEREVGQQVVREPWEVREARATAARLCRALRA